MFSSHLALGEGMGWRTLLRRPKNVCQFVTPMHWNFAPMGGMLHSLAQTRRSIHHEHSHVVPIPRGLSQGSALLCLQHKFGPAMGKHFICNLGLQPMGVGIIRWFSGGDCGADGACTGVVFSCPTDTEGLPWHFMGSHRIVLVQLHLRFVRPSGETVSIWCRWWWGEVFPFLISCNKCLLYQMRDHRCAVTKSGCSFCQRYELLLDSIPPLRGVHTPPAPQMRMSPLGALSHHVWGVASRFF